MPRARPFSSHRDPLASPAAVASEPHPFPRGSTETPNEVWYADWRRRLTRNLASRSDGRWEPLTHFEPTLTPDEARPTPHSPE